MELRMLLRCIIFKFPKNSGNRLVADVPCERDGVLVVHNGKRVVFVGPIVFFLGRNNVETSTSLQYDAVECPSFTCIVRKFPQATFEESKWFLVRAWVYILFLHHIYFFF